jgi:hypothetical protein
MAQSPTISMTLADIWQCKLEQAATAVIAVVSLAVSAVAALACSQPDAPYCASQYGAFNDNEEFDACKSEMQSYQSDVESFLSCQRNEIDDLQSKSRRVIEEHNDAVASFNRRARN